MRLEVHYYHKQNIIKLIIKSQKENYHGRLNFNVVTIARQFMSIKFSDNNIY